MAPGSARVVAIIPARYASTRLPGKPLAPIAGKPMIQHVWERAAQAGGVARTLVATDDERIAAAVRAFGGDLVMTGTHATGTDRLAEVARGLEADILVNVQGDLPLLDPAVLSACVAALADAPEVEMASLMTPIRDEAEHRNPNVVKVVTGANGCALYFSRSPLPHWRGARPADAPLGRRHIGLYGYRRAALLALAAAPRSPLECAEELEQLRALERGMRIRMIEVDSAPPEVDTAEDLERVRRLVEGLR
ncbi:MAG: 3-deoxy-manno-octulosonate cytidylyltransferase [Deltaproteobacteria bacterium]|nr:3-deoxy-manno-octulosonate cytidylyltransferase [Deltaproteobacteria bacterium]